MFAVTYKSQHVDIPDDFLRTPPAEPVTLTPVPWASSPIPEYDGAYAVILNNVLSQDECTQLLRLAEASVPADESNNGTTPWRPAMVNTGPGMETMAVGYRNSARIVWDQQDVVDRIWQRCIQAEGFADQLAVVYEEEDREFGIPKWDFRQMNKRMRFLKYGPGQFFKRMQKPLTYHLAHESAT
jgi:hypothetical protein